jgi:anti-anti-sigma regulatory factor
MTATPKLTSSISSARTLYLPSSLNPRVAETLAETFRTSRGDDILIDAANVQRVDAQCVQVLRTAVNEWTQGGRNLTVINDAADLTDLLRAA